MEYHIGLITRAVGYQCLNFTHIRVIGSVNHLVIRVEDVPIPKIYPLMEEAMEAIGIES